MVLRSAKFANHPRLEKAAVNSPPLRKGESGDAVARLQGALIDVGFSMPVTTKSGTRPPDGVYGDETAKTVGKFQLQQKLSNDGIAGRDTLTRLDQLLTANDTPAEPLPVVLRGDFKVSTARNAPRQGIEIMAIVKDSASITPDTKSVTIGYHLTTPKHVYGHLTNGFSVKQDTTTFANAWTAKGVLKLDTISNDGGDYGFIQIQRIIATGFDYVGATPADGSIRLLISEPPALKQKLALDSKDLEVVKPWTRASTSTPARFEFIPPEIKCETGDHPAVKVLKKVGNETTNKVNYLRSIVDKREFWTMLAVKEAGGSITYLQHFHWSVSYLATFKWANGTIAIDDSSKSHKQFGQVKKGPPADGALTALLANPVGPMANDMMDSALALAVTNGQGHNRKDFADGTCGGTLTVPGDFFA